MPFGYPFDRQILDLSMYIRHKKWKVVLDPPGGTPPATRRTGSVPPPPPLSVLWPEARVADCFFGARACRSFLSEAIVHYKLAPPWVEARDYEKPDWGWDTTLR